MFANLFGSKEAATPTKTPRANGVTMIGDALIPEDTTLEQVHSEFIHLKGQVEINHHRMGQLYNFVVEKKLAEQAGYKDARDYFSQRLADLSQASLSMYGAVAKSFSSTVARRFGVTCLYLLLSYKEAADLKVNHAEPGDTLIEVPDDKGQVESLPFGKCNVDQMRRALQRKRKPASTKPLPEEAVALAEHYRDAVKDRFPAGVVIKVDVRNQKGEAVLDFKGIPVGQVSKLVAALSQELPPAPPAEPVSEG